MEVTPMRNHVLLEATIERPSKILLTPAPPVPASTFGTVLKLGEGISHPEIKVGSKVLFVPHGGSIIEGEGTAENPHMVVPVDLILGVLED